MLDRMGDRHAAYLDLLDRMGDRHAAYLWLWLQGQEDQTGVRGTTLFCDCSDWCDLSWGLLSHIDFCDTGSRPHCIFYVAFSEGTLKELY